MKKEKNILHRAREERYIIHTIKRRKANRINHILRRNCLLKHVIEGEIEVTGRRRRRRKLLDDFKGNRRYCKMKEEVAICGELFLEESVA